MIASDANDVWIQVIASAALFAGAVITVFVSNRKTRALNSSEHQMSQKERESNRDAVLMAIGMVHDEVKVVKSDVTVIKTEQQEIKARVVELERDQHPGV